VKSFKEFIAESKEAGMSDENEYGYEVDFLPVGNGEKSGDAIALRYGKNGEYAVHVIDGGTRESGANLVTHIQNYYGNPTRIDHLVCTHSDGDHASGLRDVLESFDVGAVWMNRPWLYAEELVDSFKDARWTVDGLRSRLRELFPVLVEIEELAESSGTPVYEAFQDQKIGAFTVLAPSRARYLELIPQFDRTPAFKSENLGGLLEKAFKKVASWIEELWHLETLSEGEATTPPNEASIVQAVNIEDRILVFNGDAGIGALGEAADYLGLENGLEKLRFFQVPHHGSKRNVSPSVLNRWIGEPVDEGEKRDITAFVSASKESETHPRKKVVNAFVRRGVSVHPTNGKTIRHSHNMPDRPGWSSLNPLEFSSVVEE
jgi:beta-lactamase superfamily II metal-dependent hydrolase